MDQIRTEEEINQEYVQCAIDLGDRQFKIRFMENEIKELFHKMNLLNEEMRIVKNNTKVV